MKHLLLCILMLVFLSCKKYEQGGNSRQFRKKIPGNYQIELYQMWGKDSTYWAKSVCNDQVIIEFYEDEKGSAEEYYVKEGIDGAFFITNKKNILYSFAASSNFNSSIFQGQTHWSILKLTDSELWIRSDNEYIYIKMRK